MSLRLDFAARILLHSPAFRHCSRTCLTRMMPVMSRKFHKARMLHAKSDDDKSVDEKMSQAPYPFMSSLKGNVQARQDAIEIEEEWEYQSVVIFGSITAFFIYFLLLRKEREVDRAIEQNLYLGMPALEVHDLRKAIKKNKEEGKDATKQEERLKELLAPPQNRNL